jgi:crotonobetainyl-CoA:carnitine CoA-transferase CaiB-like acyl-CoA transferase
LSPLAEHDAGAHRVLDGIRVVDFSRVVAGPYCSMLLGDLGADVVKVEQPGVGDDCRSWGPPFVGDESAYFLGLNRNKRSLTLDLGGETGRGLARRLIARADVVVESFRPGRMEQFGLGYEALHPHQPGLIYCSISGFGPTGPYRDRAGYDVMVSALGGLMSITGTPGGPPVKVGVALVDVCTGLYAFSGILAALLARRTTGEGQKVEANLLATDLAVLINAASGYLAAGDVLTPQGSGHASIVPYQAFRAADGYVMIGAGNDKLFGALCRELGLAHLLGDPRFATNAGRVAHRDELVPLIEQATAAGTVDDCVRRLADAGVAVAPINTIDRVFADPHVAASGQVVTVEHATAGELRLVGPAVHLEATPAGVFSAPPTLGQHTDEVLAEWLGLEPAEISRLRRAGVL